MITMPKGLNGTEFDYKQIFKSSQAHLKKINVVCKIKIVDGIAQFEIFV